MSNSKLVSYTKLSPNCSTRTAPISKITIHHAAAVNGSLQGMGEWFAKSSTRASSNYGIDSNGKIALYVDESKRAWTSSNTANDNVAVTIEVANCKGAPNWEVSAAAYKALIDLCVDICQRNNIKELNYTGDKSGNLTRHNMFIATTCPGPYLQSKFSANAQEVNGRLKNNGATANNNKEEGVKVNIELRQLSKGATGAQVKTLQRLLNALGYSVGSCGVDGDFGNATHNAVIRYQKANGLVQDGIVGPATWGKLLKG